ncbi:hypothetical protein B0T26DRAFT_517465 [Lasiosphaeria miniovina]|uniref:Uncharacterized protein n=1 Tax=Lasiosphaeria miniovina TaxID=1954250 RepID=A0AA40DJQ4_9PEZI|nr:uncharacterized protein B0T26DRAFT_517465 [Lasiosphaeria miniovina]KAK0703896.1 hypothetical protein B0T26DRAFT_517465 [Lasiosphaeria miniovina]
MASTPTVILITGANRGLGRGLAETYLARPNVTLVAGVRDPSSASALSLSSAPAGAGSKVVLVKIDSQSDTDAAAAVATLKAQGITQIDVAIANAGVANVFGQVHEIAPADQRRFVEINTLGPLKLYAAVRPLLLAAAAAGRGTPKFVGVSTMAATTGEVETTVPYRNGAYAASKAMLNHLLRRAHFESEGIAVFAVDPGFFDSDMGKEGASILGYDGPLTSLESVTAGTVREIDNTTRESAGSKDGYIGWEGKRLAY